MTPTTSGEVATVYICLGSNIRPAENLPSAVEKLSERVGLLASSRVYEGEAKGASGTPDFLNAAVAVETSLSPWALKLEILRPLEAELGRVRTDDPNEPRTIDLDLSLHGSLVIDDPVAGLVLPDPEILTCAHVAVPLADVAPDLVHPVTDEPLKAIAARLEAASDIRPLDRPRLPPGRGL